MNKPVIGIIGVGMIGNSTAVLTTMHGCRTICYARSEHKIPQYRAGFDRMYQEMITQGILTQAQADICASYLEYATDYEGLADCEVIFEAIAEDLNQKKECYTSLERCCPKLKLIASCSSSILIAHAKASSQTYFPCADSSGRVSLRTLSAYSAPKSPYTGRPFSVMVVKVMRSKVPSVSMLEK